MNRAFFLISKLYYLSTEHGKDKSDKVSRNFFKSQLQNADSLLINFIRNL